MLAECCHWSLARPGGALDPSLSPDSESKDLIASLSLLTDWVPTSQLSSRATFEIASSPCGLDVQGLEYPLPAQRISGQSSRQNAPLKSIANVADAIFFFFACTVWETRSESQVLHRLHLL